MRRSTIDDDRRRDPLLRAVPRRVEARRLRADHGGDAIAIAEQVRHNGPFEADGVFDDDDGGLTALFKFHHQGGGIEIEIHRRRDPQQVALGYRTQPATQRRPFSRVHVTKAKQWHLRRHPLFGFAVVAQQLRQHAPHDQAGAIGQHVHLLPVRRRQRDIGIAAFQNRLVLERDRAVEGDHLLGATSASVSLR